MKNHLLAAVLISSLSLTSFGAEDSDSTGLPGDHFDLYGALSLFKDSESLEAFEKSINSEDNQINNLDLNDDGEVDYIRVVDHMDGDVHAIVLQVPVSEKESQDVAVIELEKTGDEEVTLQIVGDEELYGEDYYVEPVSEASDKDTKTPQARAARVVVNVWIWPSVRFVYGPRYKVWVSPWRWRNYPRWWKPWRPVTWRVHHRRVVHHHVHFHRVHVHRCAKAHRVYKPHRVYSKSVKKRHAAAHKRHKQHKKNDVRKHNHKKKNVSPKKKAQRATPKKDPKTRKGSPGRRSKK